MENRTISTIKKLENGSRVVSVQERVHTRKIDRRVLKHNMKLQGIRKICHQGRSSVRSGVGRGILESNKRGESHFASVWKKFGGYNGRKEELRQAE